MADTISMAVVQCLHNWNKNLSCFVLWKVAFVHYTIKKLPSLANPHYL